MKKTIILMVIAAAICIIGTAAFATTTYTTEASFTAQLQTPYYLQNLVGLTVQTGFAPGPANLSMGPINGYSWTVNAPRGLYEVEDGLSTWDSRDVLTFSFASSPTTITAVGGTFFANNNAGTTINSNVELLLNDGTVALLTTPGFRGFTSSVGIASLKVWSDIGVSSPNDGTVYAGAGKLYVGTAAVPEASTLVGFGSALVMTGPGLVGWLRRRRA